MFEWISDPNAWVALATLTTLEIVLGIDNIIFISILTGKLPEDQQAKGRTIGLGLAMGMRIVLLVSISWVMGLTAVLFDLGDLLPFLNDLEAFGSTARDTVGHGGAVEGGDTSPIALTGRDLILADRWLLPGRQVGPRDPPQARGRRRARRPRSRRRSRLRRS